MPASSRRQFLKASILAASAPLWPRALAAASTQPAGANGDIRVGVIGINQKGAAHMRQLARMPGVRVVALCDVDPRVLAHQSEVLQKIAAAPFGTTDARALVGRKDVDAVVIASSDQWHALHAIWALQAGKDVYIEKPVCRTIWEGQRMLAAAAHFGRIVQAGTQSRSDPGIAEAVKLIQSGRLGKIQWIHALCYRLRESIGRQTPWYPDWLDYDRFCGPTPVEPLNRSHLHYDWHWQWRTGGGDLANIGVHQLDIARWFAGNPATPRRTMSFGGRFGVDDAGETPNTQLAVYDFSEFPIFFEIRGLPVKAGTRIMDQVRGIREGVIVQCEQGYFAGYLGGGIFDNNGKRLQQIVGDGGGGHMANFISAVRNRTSATLAAPFAEGFKSSACCHAGNISYRLGKAATVETIQQSLERYPAAQAQLGQIARHLTSHGIDLAATPLRQGPWLELNPADYGIASAGLEPARSDQAQALHREPQRPPYVIPETF